MNLSAIMLCILVVYMWHAGSLTHEVKVIKRILIAVYETLEQKTAQLTEDMFAFKNELMLMVNKLHNDTVALIMNNTKKIDMINDKIDVLLTR
ncbi:ac130 [Malacosoma neustria nucleopolyhedrovirus]|uniref:ac130 n=1 Tax=Malacosoma neustria nuclear polyhedrosis virus TaxID=38012 RepID=UPI000E35B527|nr:ac130 [Malacosoma neustria nucleopolyhedrovirus]AUF81648.1 ac130 [Malacosoma neustria nucleopolyhedrovirus]